MRIENQSELRKIERVSGLLLKPLYLMFLGSICAYAALIYITLYSPTYVAKRVLDPIWDLSNSIGQMREGLWTIQEKKEFLIQLAMPALVFLLGIYFAIRLVQCFRNGGLFSQRSIRYARRIAYVYLAAFGCSIMYFIHGIWSGSGSSIVTPVSLLEELFILGLVWLFVWIYTVASVIHKENEMTI